MSVAAPTALVGDVAIPPGDPGALRAAARTFTAAAESAGLLATRTDAAAHALVPWGWFGLASLEFRAAAGLASADVQQAPIAFRDAAAALTTLASELEEAQKAAKSAQAAAGEVNSRSARLQARFEEARTAEAKGHDVSFTGLASEAQALSYEAAAVSFSASAAAERARTALQKASAEFERITGTAPSLRRAFAAAHVKGHDGYDPLASLSRGDIARWYELLEGKNACGPGYSGIGGFVAGPDGLDYPLVVPHLMIASVDYNGNRGGAQPSLDVHSLGGRDPGWRELYSLQGVTRIHGKPSWWEKIFIGIAGTNPNLTPPNTPLGKDEFQLLGIAGGGAPYIATRRRAPKATGVGAKDFEVKISSPTLVRVGGELVTVDRNSPETWNREIRRSGLTPNTRAENMSRAIGALNLVEAAGEGVELTRMADDAGLAAYQLVFETNDDGRRRAFLRVYQVMVENDTGTYVINPTHVSVGPDGKPDFQTIRFHFEPEIRPAGEKPSYRIVQPPPPDGG